MHSWHNIRMYDITVIRARIYPRGVDFQELDKCLLFHDKCPLTSGPNIFFIRFRQYCQCIDGLMNPPKTVELLALTYYELNY
jgi:hypothetical protein